MNGIIPTALCVASILLCAPNSGAAQSMTALEVTQSTSASAEGLSGVLDQLMGLETTSLAGLSAGRIREIAAPYVAPLHDGEDPRILEEAALDAMPAYEGGAEWQCLTQALYFEARGEPVVGQYAVAEVILNRVDHRNYPTTICNVVNEGTGRRFACQFTYTCDGLPEEVTDQRAWHRLGQIAQIMMDGAPRDLTDGATHYHADWVNPRWARLYPQTAEIGIHAFYRQQY